MGELIFKYGSMNSAKSISLLTMVHNNEMKGRPILCLKSSLDTRWADNSSGNRGLISSRVGVSHECELVSPVEDLYKLVTEYNRERISNSQSRLGVLFIDEAQFLTHLQVKQLSQLADNKQLDLKIMCYGLKNTFQDGILFEGSRALLYYSDIIEEIKTDCRYCSKKAIMNLRVVHGQAVRTGDTDIVVGDVQEGDDYFVEVCREHYFSPPSTISKEKKTKQGHKSRLSWILNYANEDGYFSLYTSANKLNHFLGVKSYSKLEYLVIGDLKVNLRKIKPKLNSLVVTDGFIKFIYAYIDNNLKAYQIIKKSIQPGLIFFDNKNDMLKDKGKRQGKNINKYYKELPDGRWYFYDLHKEYLEPFWEALFSGVAMEIGFETKMGFIYEDKLEIERKYLIKKPDFEELKDIYDVKSSNITQVYLNSVDNVERRVRKETTNGLLTYYYTEKIKRTNISRLEKEKEISKLEYNRLLQEKEVSLNEINKIRYRFDYSGFCIEIDVYDFWGTYAILEVEIDSEDTLVVLPPEIEVIKEVTEDNRFKNNQLAKNTNIV